MCLLETHRTLCSLSVHDTMAGRYIVVKEMHVEARATPDVCKALETGDKSADVSNPSAQLNPSTVCHVCRVKMFDMLTA